MTILEDEVIIKINSANYIRLEKLGYELPKYLNYKGEYVVKQKEEIKIKVRDLSVGSRVYVTKICDECKCIIPNQVYAHVITNRNRSDGKDRCKKCSRKKGENTKNENIRYENSLEFYAEKNNKNCLLIEYSDKNKQKTSEIKFASNSKFLWKCMECNSEFLATVNNRINGNGCPYCSGQKVNETNSLASLNPDVARLLTKHKDGYTITSGSGEKLFFTCPRCKDVSRKIVKNVVKHGIGCTKCGDGISYPEKFLISLLKQLEVNFETQKVFDWSSNKRYDFFVEAVNCIIETHGAQHYQENSSFHISLLDEQFNDKLKKELAEKNGITDYVTINCSESNLEYIRKNIVNSKLSLLFDITKIDWLYCHQFACSSLVKTVCDLWKTTDKTTVEIGGILGIHQTTALRYIKQGVNLGWCEYDRIQSYKRIFKSKPIWNKTKIVQLTKEGEFVRCWGSMTEAAKELNLYHSNISRVCTGKLKSTGGYNWKYLNDYENNSNSNNSSN